MVGCEEDETLLIGKKNKSPNCFLKKEITFYSLLIIFLPHQLFGWIYSLEMRLGG